MASALNEIKEWLTRQPHLPQNVDEKLLRRFLHCCDQSLEKAKHLVDFFFTVRSQAPEIFADRDPTDPVIQSTLEHFEMIPLPNLTNKNYQLLFYRFANNNAENFNYVATLKCLFMLADVRMMHLQEIPDGEIPIFDMKNFTLKHMTKVNLTVMKKYMVYSQEAHPVKLKQIHNLNIPPYIDRCMTMVKPFMKKEIGQLLNFHQPNSSTLFNFIDQELLPEEYGGKSCSVEECKKIWSQRLIDYRDFFLDESRWKVDESKRPSNNTNSKQMFGMQGSFRTLSID